MTNKANKVLVVGNKQTGKKHIVQQIIQTNPTTTEATVSNVSFQPNTASLPETSPITYHTANWPCVTKYYRAHIEFNVLSDDVVPEFTPDSLNQLVQSNLIQDIQSMLLVYDASSKQSFERITRWAALINSAVSSDRVILCIANERNPQSVDQSVIAAAHEWCNNHNIEHLSVPFLDLMSQSISVDDHRHDDDGVPRIIQALHVNQWDDMLIKSEAEQRADMQARASRAEKADAEELLSYSDQLDKDQADEEAEFEAHLAEQDRLAAERVVQIAALNSEQPPLVTTEQEELTVEQEERLAEQVEQQLAGFENMFERMRSIRAEAVAARQSSTNSTSDAERRKRAEDAIISMLTSMGLDISDDDDEDL